MHGTGLEPDGPWRAWSFSDGGHLYFLPSQAIMVDSGIGDARSGTTTLDDILEDI